MGEVTPFYRDDWLSVFHGDCREVMASLPAESVHCVVTSPPLEPYWGLRDYGTATWEGGDAGCDHTSIRRPGEADKSYTNGGTSRDKPTTACRRCGATRIDAQLGLEPTPEEYVANLVAVFREVRRVLRKDGTVWLNLGDSYNGVGRGEKANGLQIAARTSTQRTVPGLKPKDLVGIPWRVAFALQADGWYLRSDIIWSKPNPMPESVTDRPTKSHEYLFLLAKSARYYFDADAVREPHVTADDGRNRADFEPQRERNRGGRTDGYTAATGAFSWPEAGRNIRSVWTVATAPYPGAHFATFPPKLIEPCIKAGTSERGVCPECGAPWERVVETGPLVADPDARIEHWDRGKNVGTGGAKAESLRASGFVPNHRRERETTGWRPSCAHVSPLPPRPATILDPFAGSGTTGMVAQSLSRRAVLIDLSLDYLGQLMDRNADIPLGLGA